MSVITFKILYQFRDQDQWTLLYQFGDQDQWTLDIEI